MRKIILSTLALAAAVVVLHAEGYQLNLNSTKQAGMGNTGVALKLGSESMIYNPAGLSFINGSVGFAAGVTGVRSFVSYENGSYKAETDNPLGTPLFFYAGFKITKNLAAGVSLNNPAGNSIFWPENWNGATIVQNSKLQVFSVQPTLSLKFLDDKLSIGAGAMVMWGSFSQAKALIAPNALASLAGLIPALGQYTDVVPVSAKLYGDAKINYGFNVGLLFTPIPQLSIGVSYRSKVDMKVDEGNTDLIYADDAMKQILSGLAQYGVTVPPLDQSTFSASMPIPANLNFGFSFRPSNELLLTAEGHWVGWGVFEELVIKYDAKLGNLEIKNPKEYKNTMIYRFGGQWTAFPSFDLRLGFYYDTTPVDLTLYTPETPGSNKMAFTGGFSYRPVGGLSVDVAFTYSNGAKTSGSFPTEAGKPAFTGDYKVYALLPSFGLSYNF